MVVIHVSPHTTKYVAGRCSWAYFWWLACWCGSIIAPYFIAYHMNGLWLKEAVRVQQPRARFKHSVIVALEGTKKIGNDVLAGYHWHWSTESSVNALFGSDVRVAEVSSVEVDDNRDGKPDTVEVTVAVPLLDGENIHQASAALFFNYTLDDYVTMDMEGMAYVQGGSALAGSRLWVSGDLRFRQLGAIVYMTPHTLYRGSVINAANPRINDVLFPTMLGNYAQRNLTTFIGNEQQVWTAGDGGSADGLNRFEIVVRLKIPDEQVRYIPGFWETVKKAWVQYLAIFFVARYFIGKIEIFLHEYSVVETSVLHKQVISRKPNF